MSESNFPRRSNLIERKRSVLRIAAENFKMVKRLQSARSGGYAEEVLSGRGTPISSRSSRINFAYPNQIEHKRVRKTQECTRNPLIINKKYVPNILGLKAIPAQAVSARNILVYS